HSDRTWQRPLPGRDCRRERHSRDQPLLSAVDDPVDPLHRDRQRSGNRTRCGAPRPEIKTITAIEREQSNSSVIVDNKYVIKILRRVTAGIHPEIEIGRFLVDVAHFQNAPSLLGTVELVEGENRTALVVMHAFVENQGDAWTVTSASLDRLVDEQRLLPTEAITE